MEILLVLALIIAAGAGNNAPPPQQLIRTFSALSSGKAEDIWKSDLFKDVRILGMTPAELIGAAKELNALVSALSAASSSDGETQTAAETFEEAPPAAAREDREDALAPVRGIADENIQRMLGKYFS